MRPSRLSSPSSSDCTPIEMRFTPCSRRSLTFSAETVAGLHSTVHSAAPSRSSRSIAPRMRRHWAVLSSDGVPPPKKTVRGLSDGATNSISRISAST